MAYEDEIIFRCLLAEKADVVDCNGLIDKRRVARFQRFPEHCRLGIGQVSGESHVKSEFFHHIRISPAIEQVLLAV